MDNWLQKLLVTEPFGDQDKWLQKLLVTRTNGDLTFSVENKNSLLEIFNQIKDTVIQVGNSCGSNMKRGENSNISLS